MQSPEKKNAEEVAVGNTVLDGSPERARGYHDPETLPASGPERSPVKDDPASLERARGSGGGVRPKTSPVVGRPELLVRHPELAGLDWSAIEARFPVRVPRTWGVTPELLRQALPDPRELEPAEGDVADPVGEQQRSPLPWVVRKHEDRVLLLLTKRCHLYCRYCFRADHQPGSGEDPTSAEWRTMLAYARDSGAREVILSGGDPLAIPDPKLYSAIDGVRPDPMSTSGPRAPVVRIHTRAPITSPSRVTPELVQGLAARAPVWVIVHCNHPAELTPPVRTALARFVDAGIPVLNQSVLLKGVNDDAAVLAELCETLVTLRVFPYYLHHPDAVPGNAHFRVSLDAGRAIYAALSRKVSGLALPRYVIDPPDGSGKRDVG